MRRRCAKYAAFQGVGACGSLRRASISGMYLKPRRSTSRRTSASSQGAFFFWSFTISRHAMVATASADARGPCSSSTPSTSLTTPRSSTRKQKSPASLAASASAALKFPAIGAESYVRCSARGKKVFSYRNRTHPLGGVFLSVVPFRSFRCSLTARHTSLGGIRPRMANTVAWRYSTVTVMRSGSLFRSRSSSAVTV